MRIGIAQINATVGDLAGNVERILGVVRDAEFSGSAVVLFPELALTGYPPEDLVFKPAFIRDTQAALQSLARQINNCAAAVGFVDARGSRLYNAAAWLYRGRVRGIYRKQILPNYGVFDEARYFTPGDKAFVTDVHGVRIGLTICEDMWRGAEPVKPLAKLRPHIVLNLSASPFHVGKTRERISSVGRATRALNAPLLYANLVGGQDELIFDGGSFVLSPTGTLKARCPQFTTGLFPFDFSAKNGKPSLFSPPAPNPPLDPVDEIHGALVLGIRDYVDKNGFEKVTLGLSGGLDSALVAALAVEALGPDRVVTVSMPSPYSSNETRRDAKRLAENLALRLLDIPISDAFDVYLESLKPLFDGRPPDLTEENLQARIRGNMLMALSNKFGWLVLTTGNKSETSVGYCTLYGDMAGGFAVLKDVLKTTAYALAARINEKAGRPLIPPSIIARPPTAELRPDQRDEDSLGSYADLDRLIVGYVERNRSTAELVKETGLPRDYVFKVIRLIDRNEYKRRQAAPGIKITTRAFGRDHRMPITNRYNPRATSK